SRAAHLLLFLFLCYAHPRVLPSFPTRRSSDLTFGVFFIGFESSAADFVSVVSDKSSAWLASGSSLSSVNTGSLLSLAPTGSGVEDRKSTRLNSSHVSISYAVFCLKTKEQTSSA